VSIGIARGLDLVFLAAARIGDEPDQSFGRSGRALSGRARNPPAPCVVSMQTPTDSMMVQTRSIA